ncbi:hypothetical protein [Paenibacillus sonchi]|uniref:hypothetical protein n=1 Tax=Paenibacillus sonchi TaxID=373687 RepID=UPI001E564B2B|nr:hypothetical protein [Paenibacillus sonchi]MCE3199902.1 hypothetical protein [Paenibacillus sonchi]
MKKFVASLTIVGFLLSAPASIFASSNQSQPEVTQSIESVVSPAEASKTAQTSVTYYNVTSDFEAPSTFFYVDTQWAGTLKRVAQWFFKMENGYYRVEVQYEGTVYRTGPMASVATELTE